MFKLSNTQIPFLKPQQIYNLKPNLISFFSTDQMTSLTNQQIKVLTNYHIQKLSLAQLSIILTNLTPAQIRHLTDNHLKYLSAIQLTNLSTEKIDSLSDRQLLYIRDNNSNYDDSTHAIISSLIDKINNKPTWTLLNIPTLTDIQDKIKVLNTEQLQVLTVANQSTTINLLRPSQIPLLQTSLISSINLESLPPHLLISLSTSQIQLITQTQISQLSTNIQNFSYEQIRSFFPQQISWFGDNTKLNLFTANQIYFMSNGQLSAIKSNHLNQLTENQLSILSMYQFNSLSLWYPTPDPVPIT